MRKVEQQMVAAISKRERMSVGNTSVEETNDGVIVRLHGNKICEVSRDSITIYDGGFESNTTKSRLNAILYGVVSGGWFVQQEKGTWFLRNRLNSVSFEWKNGALFAMDANLIRII